MRVRWYAIVPLLLCGAILHAQEDSIPANSAWAEEGVPYEEYAQDTVVPAHVSRDFDGSALSGYRNDPSLQYDKPLPPEEPGLWERFVDWLTRTLARWFGKPIASAVNVLFTKYIIHALIIGGALLLFILALRRAVFTSALRGKPMRASTVNDVHAELEREDLDALAAEAERAGEWRRAVRLRYLQVLRHCIDRGLLQWRPEHTDRDYTRQLSDPAQRNAFGGIVFTFQWVWYGDAALDADRYALLIAPFRAFTSERTT